jgi:hypothetical protein
VLEYFIYALELKLRIVEQKPIQRSKEHAASATVACDRKSMLQGALPVYSHDTCCCQCALDCNNPLPGGQHQALLDSLIDYVVAIRRHGGINI